MKEKHDKNVKKEGSSRFIYIVKIAGVQFADENAELLQSGARGCPAFLLERRVRHGAF